MDPSSPTASLSRTGTAHSAPAPAPAPTTTAATVTSAAPVEPSQETSHYDYAIVGTSLTQCILAGALARIGKRVIVVDAAETYGGDLVAGSLGTVCRHVGHRDPAAVYRNATWHARASASVDAAFAERICDRRLAQIEAAREAVKAQRLAKRKLRESETSAAPAGLDTDAGQRNSSEADLNDAETEQNEEHEMNDDEAAPDAYTPTREDRIEIVITYLEKHGVVAEAILRACDLATWAPPSDPSSSDGTWARRLRQHLATWPHREQQQQPAEDPLRRLMVAQYLFELDRQFTLEVTPKLLLARGPLVQALVRSGVGQYMEFRSVDSAAFAWKGALQALPARKEDIFLATDLSLMEKRRLMRVFKTALEYASPSEHGAVSDDGVSPTLSHQGLTFAAYCVEHKVPDKYTALLQQLLFPPSDATHAGASPTAAEGLAALKAYLTSFGAYAPSAFLAAVYGTGSELAQAFARLAAVYGSLFIMGHLPDAPITRQANPGHAGRWTVQVAGETFTADRLIADPAAAQRWIASEHVEATRPSPSGCLARAIVLTRHPLFTAQWRSSLAEQPDAFAEPGRPAHDDHLPPPLVETTQTESEPDHVSMLLCLAQDDGVPAADRAMVTGLQMGYSVAAVPRGMSAVALWAPLAGDGAAGGPEAVLRPVVERLRQHAQANPACEVLFDVYYAQPVAGSAAPADVDQDPASILYVEDTLDTLEADGMLLRAQRLFAQLCPGEPFLPERANPEQE
ncbi:hypothetical protein CXG81DRAFT_21385 [Caulochytrium protostelioides]|uniref:Uncharacterized protein n=1 Tax=Caulochytrium protostelioides TaxID=1555241 RepID=A0A4P9X0U3_9FUNG|nr:hypothetical protein CXG81DRAFT_21385 [Caulochytrium protostelioides]|eukprot:RKO98373.1 hypothetical protein CXG81DRAFT_21385 [Caulochytrium protostelioides]